MADIVLSEQLKAILSDPIRAEITACKVRFLMENPFIGQIATKLESIEAPWCRTGATDGRNLYWNREFMKSLNRDQKLFFIAHEVYHICFDHVGRRGNRDPAIWNMACLAWDTPILMADGSVQPIQRVLPGDYIASPFGPNKVLGNMFSGKKKVGYFAYQNSGHELIIKATLDHKFFSEGDFLEADFIRASKKEVHCLKHLHGFGTPPSLHKSNREKIAKEFSVYVEKSLPVLFVRNDYDDFGVSTDLDIAENDKLQKAAREFRGINSAKYMHLLSEQDKYFKTHLYRTDLVGHEQEEPVFDLVTEFGSFFANGILTHNCDYNINYSLKREGIGSPPTRDGKEMILYDERYTDDMSAYEIYDLLIENSTTIELPLDEHLDIEQEDGDGNDDEDNQGDAGGGDSEGDGDQDQDGDGEGQGKGSKQKTTKLRVLGKDGPPKLTKEEIEKLRQEIRSNIISAAQQAGAGSIPAGLRKMINQLIEPKLDWHSLLDAYIRSSVKDDYSFQNISRRSWGCSGAILPGQNFTERVEVFCAIDASGSTTSEMVTQFLSELCGIATSFPDFKIDVVSFDTEVYNHVIITPENIDDLYNYEIRGDGGTMFECIYEFLKRESIEPERLVFLTDGYPNSSWGDPNYADTIFIIHSNSHITAPFGLTAHIHADDKMFRKK